MHNPTCAVCERGISERSPKADEIMRRVSGTDHEDEAGTKCDAMDLPVPFDGQSVAHGLCKGQLDFLKSLGVNEQTTARRLAGYKAGKSFGAYMNPPYGLDHPAVNSHRVLEGAFRAMEALKKHWVESNVLTGDYFREEPVYASDPNILVGYRRFVADLTMDETVKLWSFTLIAQSVLSHAVILWMNAHGDNQRSNDQEMFLKREMYEGTQWERIYEHFSAKRNKAIGHIDKSNWDSVNAERPHQSYPEWIEEWQGFEGMLGHSIDLCVMEIQRLLGRSEPTSTGRPMSSANSGDPVQPAADCLTAFGFPAIKRTTIDKPLSERKWYRLLRNDTKWIAGDAL